MREQGARGEVALAPSRGDIEANRTTRVHLRLDRYHGHPSNAEEKPGTWVLLQRTR